MRQRVALIRVLAADPSILLMDEPFAALDALTRTFFSTNCRRSGSIRARPSFFVTHNVDEAIFLAIACDHVSSSELCEVDSED